MDTNSPLYHRVRVLDETFPKADKFDYNGNEVVHSVIVQRVGDGVTLAKYRETEFVDNIVEKTDPKTKNVTRRRVQVTISGREAAKRACEVNGWVITKN